MEEKTIKIKMRKDKIDVCVNNFNGKICDDIDDCINYIKWYIDKYDDVYDIYMRKDMPIVIQNKILMFLTSYYDKILKNMGEYIC